MEHYGEFAPVLPLDDPTARAVTLAALDLADGNDDPVCQASIFHNLVGQVSLAFTAFLPVVKSLTLAA